MQTSKIPPHEALASLCHPSASRIDRDRLTEAFGHLGRFTTGHVLQRLGLPITRGNEMAVAKHARSIGYLKARVMVSGSQHWVFFPPQEAVS